MTKAHNEPELMAVSHCSSICGQMSSRIGSDGGRQRGDFEAERREKGCGKCVRVH